MYAINRPGKTTIQAFKLLCGSYESIVVRARDIRNRERANNKRGCCSLTRSTSSLLTRDNISPPATSGKTARASGSDVTEAVKYTAKAKAKISPGANPRLMRLDLINEQTGTDATGPLAVANGKRSKAYCHLLLPLRTKLSRKTEGQINAV